MITKIKILQLSAGSLIGKGLLDTLASRRTFCELTAINTSADSAHLYQFDNIYLAPESNSNEFESFLIDIISKVEPNLILPGRDDDVVLLSVLAEKHENIRRIVCQGSATLAKIIRDKYTTYNWTKKHKLPFVESFFYQHGNDKELHEFVDKVGFPIISKPREGFGSNGVFVATTMAQIKTLCDLPGIMFQKFLMVPRELDDLISRCHMAIPLHYQIADEQQFAGQTFITETGDILPIFTSVSKMVLGRCEGLEVIKEPDLERITKDYAQALSSDGWIGPVNVQYKKNENEQWLAHEINLRMSGGTSSRLLLGYDEIGNLLNAFRPNDELPNLSHSLKNDKVVRMLGDHLLERDAKLLLEKHGFLNKYQN